jgi:hypothetical protein
VDIFVDLHMLPLGQSASVICYAPKWTSTIIDNFLFNQTRKRLESLVKQGKRPLMLWDDSRLEKAESWFLEGLCSVESSKAKRLTRIKKATILPE